MCRASSSSSGTCGTSGSWWELTTTAACTCVVATLRFRPVSLDAGIQRSQRYWIMLQQSILCWRLVCLGMRCGTGIPRGKRSQHEHTVCDCHNDVWKKTLSLVCMRRGDRVEEATWERIEVDVAVVGVVNLN